MKQVKKFYGLLLMGLLMAPIITGCSSKEDKIAKIIKKDLFESLYDFESYQPIDTKIDSLKADQYGDTLVYDKVMVISVAFDRFDEALEKFNEQKDIADLYTPTYYSTSYTIKKFDEARDIMKKQLNTMKVCQNISDSLYKVVKERVKKCDGNHYGWFVSHKFRCKSKGGDPGITTYYYFIDKKCKKILRSFHENELTLERYKSIIDEILKSKDKKGE